MPQSVLGMLDSGPLVIQVKASRLGRDAIYINGVAAGVTAGQLSSLDLILATMRASGIDHRVLSPPPFTYRYADSPASTLQLAHLLNEATAAAVSEHPDRFVGLATVPLQDPDLACQELVRAIDVLNLQGVTLGTNVGGLLLSDPSLRKFFALISERGLPVLVHPEFVPSPRYADYYLVNVIGMPVETGTTVANLAFSGLFETLPALRICFVHGGGIAPYLLGRWNHTWHVREDISRDTTRPPPAQLDNVYWDTLTHSPEALAFLVRLMGAERVVVGTDAPFDVQDSKPLENLAAAPGLTVAERTEIRSRSPLRWLNGAGHR